MAIGGRNFTDAGVNLTVKGEREFARGMDKAEGKVKSFRQQALDAQRKTNAAGKEFQATAASSAALATGIGAAAVAFVQLAREGAKAQQVAKAFRGDLEALRKATANTVDATTLQGLDTLARELGYQQQQIEGIFKRAQDLANRGLGTTAENIEKLLKGEAEGLRALGIQVDLSAERFDGLSEAQKKQAIASEQAAIGNKLSAEALAANASSMAQAEAQMADLVSEIQVGAAQWLEQTGILETAADVLQTVTGFWNEHGDTIMAVGETAIGPMITALEMFVGGLELILGVAGPVIDFFEEWGGVIGAVLDPFGAIIDYGAEWLGLAEDMVSVTGELERQFGHLQTEVAETVVKIQRATTTVREFNEASGHSRQAMLDQHHAQERVKNAFNDILLTMDSTTEKAKRLADISGDSAETFERYAEIYGLVDTNANLYNETLLVLEQRENAANRSIESTTSALDRQREALAALQSELQAAGAAGGLLGGQGAVAPAGTFDGLGAGAVGGGAFGGTAQIGGVGPNQATIQQGSLEQTQALADAGRMDAVAQSAQALKDAFADLEDPIARSTDALALFVDIGGDVMKAVEGEEGALKSLADTGITSVGQFAASFVQGKRKQAGIMVPFELAAAAASYPDFVGMAQHTIAAGLYGAVAAGAGSSSSSSGGSSGAGAAGRRRAAQPPPSFRDIGGQDLFGGAGRDGNFSVTIVNLDSTGGANGRMGAVRLFEKLNRTADDDLGVGLVDTLIRDSNAGGW